MRRFLTSTAFMLGAAAAALTAAIPAPSRAEQRPPLPPYFYGVTLDDVGSSKLSAEVTALHDLSRVAIARIVFDEGEQASYYVNPVQQIGSVAWVMGELLDSEYVSTYTVPQFTARVTQYLNTLGPAVDLWEVCNECNGEWLGTTSDVLAKLNSAYSQVKAKGWPTALTLYWNGPADDGTNSDWSDAGHEMLVWAQNIDPTVRNGVAYVLVSWYPGDNTNTANSENKVWSWNSVFSSLHILFPNAKLGFGEIGTTNKSLKASYIQTYYALKPAVPGWIGGVFWWYAAEDFVPYTRALWTTFNNTIAHN